MRKLLLAALIIGGIVLLVAVLPWSAHLLKTKLASNGGGSSSTHQNAGNSSDTSAQQTVSGTGLISRNVPAFASSENNPASAADDGSYDTAWRSQGSPAWLTYDLSQVPASQRSKILLVWYNETGNYDHTLIKTPAYNIPQNYTVDVNAAAGGGQPPSQGWISLVTVQGNHYHSRQHLITMTGYNWIRLNVTAIDGSVENIDASLNMDIYNANTALTDDWIFFGDSITEGSMGHETLNGIASFAQLIHASSSSHFPIQESGGTGYLTSADSAPYLNEWLKLFPGKYVGLSYGTNDALDCVAPETFYNTYTTIVQDVLHEGKIPLVPLIPWGINPNIQRCAPALNTQILRLYQTFPQIIHGPDLWTFFKAHQNLISSDTIHPNDSGFGAERQQWAESMLAEVYH